MNVMATNPATRIDALTGCFLHIDGAIFNLMQANGQQYDSGCYGGGQLGDMVRCAPGICMNANQYN